MAADSERMRLVIETQVVAEAKIRQLRTELNKLGGAPMVKAQREIKKLTHDIRQLSGEAGKARPVWTRFTQGIAIGNLAARAAEEAVVLLKRSITELGKTAMVAAQVRELGNVMMFIGQRAGYSKIELEGYREELLKSGIAQKQTNQAMLRALQANIDLTDAVKFGRVARDAATIGLTDSSDAYMRIVDSVAKLMPRQLKELGIIINLDDAYAKYAEEHGRVAAHLTETEKKQAFINEIFDKGEIVAGAYEEAMFNVSKRVRSLPRLYQDLQVAIGEQFNPVLEVSVAMVEELLLDLTSLADTGVDLDTNEAKEGIVELREKARLFMATMVSMGETVYAVGGAIKNTIALLIVDPLIGMALTANAVFEALSHPFDITGWKIAGEKIRSTKDAFVDDFGEIKEALGRAFGDAATENLMANAEKIGDSMAKMRGQIGKEDAPTITTKMAVEIPSMLPNIDEWEGEVDAFGQTFDNLGKIAVETMGAATFEISAMQKQMVSSIFAMGDAMVDGLMQGRIQSKQIFKGMATDFIKFFVRKALASIMSSFIPGLGSLLGAMFDTPRYDKMAAQQGEDFAEYFMEGTMRKMSSLAPAMAYAGGSMASRNGQATPATINMYVSGNVMADDFVERKIGPTLERLSIYNRSNMVTKKRNVTGDADVHFN